MECQTSDSKKILKVFDASKRKHTKKKREGFDDSNSVATDDSTNGYPGTGHRVPSAKGSQLNLPADMIGGAKPETNSSRRDRESSPSVSPVDRRRSSHSPRRHRRVMRDGISLALKRGLVSTPRSISPRQDHDGVIESIPPDQDSFIYALLEEAVKRDKKKQRQGRRHDDRVSRDREGSAVRDHRQRHRRRRDDTVPRDRDKERNRKERKEESHKPVLDQAVLLETFAKLCAQINEKSPPQNDVNQVPRTQSHKSLQCEVPTRSDSYHVEKPVKLQSRQVSRDDISPSRIRSHGNFRSRETNIISSNVQPEVRQSQCVCHSPYDKDAPKYGSKMNMTSSRVRNSDSRYHDYPDNYPPGNCVINDYYRTHPSDRREYRVYNDHRDPTRDRPYDKRNYCEQKTSRSFDVPREVYEDRGRRTVRSDYNRDKFYPESRDFRDKRYADSPRDKYYDEKPCRDRTLASKERSRRNLERFERNSIASRDDDYRERYSERERDSGLSVADGETSTISGRSNCLRVVKQEISEQREAMDKMMKLWKELMRCFKGISQTQCQDSRGVEESAANVRESAAAQLRLWRECMRRYETVARDVGDTDARLMEEINKQRSEMSEMANMWQECLQRYRDMSNDFNNLKQKLNTPESPTRLPAPPLVCAEGEGMAPAAPYRLPPNYPPMPAPPMIPEYPRCGSPLGQRVSAPPAWWWTPDNQHRSPRRRSSPDSRGSRDRRRRNRERDRDDTRYKEKSKPNAARSEHKHRKR